MKSIRPKRTNSQNYRENDLLQALLNTDQVLNQEIMKIFSACIDRQNDQVKEKIKLIKESRITK